IMGTLPTESPAAGPSLLRMVFYNDRGLRAGWRLLIFAAMLIAIVFGLQMALRRAGPGGGFPATSGYGFPVLIGISDLVAFLIFLLVSWIMSRIERQRVANYGLPLRKTTITRFCTGWLFWGFLPLSIVLLIMRAFHVFYFGNLALHGRQILVWGLIWGFAFLMVGLFEEYSLRGYALHTLADGIGFWPAAIVLALVFARLHMGNSGETRIGVVATGFFALFAAATLRATGDLWLAVGAHAGWNWGQSFFYGVNDSGMQAPGHLLNSTQQGPIWLTGGTVGPEGSVITLVLWALMMVLFLFLYRSKREAAMVMVPAESSGPPSV
ncbi:MAG TPA: type II CAAX endopeptidase family protein, partial [Terriglobales bacterium]|nr:type II CAAX endopeptidase family protein [Terriglobales bacterium]